MAVKAPAHALPSLWQITLLEHLFSLSVLSSCCHGEHFVCFIGLSCHLQAILHPTIYTTIYTFFFFVEHRACKQASICHVVISQYVDRWAPTAHVGHPPLAWVRPSRVGGFHDSVYRSIDRPVLLAGLKKALAQMSHIRKSRFFIWAFYILPAFANRSAIYAPSEVFMPLNRKWVKDFKPNTWVGRALEDLHSSPDQSVRGADVRYGHQATFLLGRWPAALNNPPHSSCSPHGLACNMHGRDILGAARLPFGETESELDLWKALHPICHLKEVALLASLLNLPTFFSLPKNVKPVWSDFLKGQKVSRRDLVLLYLDTFSFSGRTFSK